MEGYIYILFSVKDGKTYVGSTNDLERRLKNHQNGLVRSTKDRLPVKLVYSEKYDTLKEAREKERYYKNCSGRKKLKVLLKDMLR